MKRDLFIFPNGKEIYSGNGQNPVITSVTYTQMVNDATDLDYGAACAGMIETALLDTSGAFSISASEEIAYYSVAEDGTRTLQGYFILEKPTKPSANTCKFTAYDRMIRFDKDLSMWLASLEEWPYTMTTLLSMVCEQCGVELAAGVELINGNFEILQFIQQVTGRQIIKWIAGANAAFANITPEGKLTFRTYTDAGDMSLAVKSIKLADYTTANIERVVVKQHEDDVGVSWPENSEGETYTVLNNPLLATMSTADLLPYVKRIADRVIGISYTPAEVQVFDPEGLCRPGIFLSVSDRYGKRHKTAVFSVKHSGGTSSLKSTGNYSRNSAGAVNGKDSVKVLQGRVAKLRADLEQVSSELSKTTIAMDSIVKEQSEITQTVDGINTKVTKTEQKADNLRNEAILEPVITRQNTPVVTVENALADSIEGLTIYGKTTQSGTPTSPVPLESAGAGGAVCVTVAGKNLFSGSSKLTVNESGGVYCNLNVGTYTISAVATSTDTDDTRCLVYDNTNGIVLGYLNRNTRSSVAFTLAKPTKVIILYASTKHSMSLGDTATFTDIQIEKGSAATAYEPYKGQTLTASTPNGLNGVPMPDNVGDGFTYTYDYIDGDGKKRIADYVDEAKGVRVQRFKRYKVTQAYDFHGVKNGFGQFSLMLPSDRKLGSYCLCSHYPVPIHYNGADYSNPTRTCVIYKRISSNPGYLFVNHEGITTLEDYNAWLAENQPEFLYELAQPIETPLSAEEKAAFQTLGNPTGVVTIFSEADLFVALSNIASGRSVENTQQAANKAQRTADAAEDSASAANGKAEAAQGLADAAYDRADEAMHETLARYSEISQKADGLGVSVTELRKAVDTKAGQAQVNEITEHFLFASDGLTITNSGTGMGINVSEKQVAFTGGNAPTTVITPNAMQTTNLHIDTRLDVGGFSLIPRSNENLSLRWTGG